MKTQAQINKAIIKHKEKLVQMGFEIEEDYGNQTLILGGRNGYWFGGRSDNNAYQDLEATIEESKGEFKEEHQYDINEIQDAYDLIKKELLKEVN